MTSGVYTRTQKCKDAIRLVKLGKKYPKELYPNYGMRNKHQSEKFKKLLSKSLTGRHHTEETKIKIGLSNSLSKKGKKLSDKHKKNISNALKKNSPNFGKKLSEESIRKRTETRRKNDGYIAWNKGLSKETDERVKKMGDKQSTTMTGRPSTNKGKKYPKELYPNYGMRKKTHNNIWNKGKKGLQIAWNKGKKLSKKQYPNYGIRKIRQNIILPLKDTSIEIKIQNFLNQLKIEFFTHQYIKEIEHGYQCDILVPSLNLVIECDGDYWHKYPIGRDIDHIRTKELLKNGFKVLRLWECEIRVMKLNEFKEKLK